MEVALKKGDEQDNSIIELDINGEKQPGVFCYDDKGELIGMFISLEITDPKVLKDLHSKKLSLTFS